MCCTHHAIQAPCGMRHRAIFIMTSTFSRVCVCGVCVVVIVPIDRRKNLGDLKKILEPEVQVPSMEFKVRSLSSAIL